MRRRAFLGIAAGAVLAGCGSGLGGPATPARGTTETPRGMETGSPTELPPVFMLTDYAHQNPHWQDLAGTFETATGIQTRVEPPGWDLTLSKLREEGEPPDVYTDRFTLVLDHYAAGRLTPTTDLVTRAEDVLGPALAEPYSESGESYQLPHSHAAETFTYRTDIYEQLGLDPPQSFQDVVANARAIDEASIGARGYGFPGRAVGKSQYEFQAYLARMGIPPSGLRWRDPDAKQELEVYFPEAEVTTLLEFFDTLAAYSPDPTTIGWAESLEQWMGGAVAQQYHVNNWLAGFAARGPGDNFESQPQLAQNTGIAPLPHWTGGNVDRTDSWANKPAIDGSYIFAGGANTPGAYEWLSWLYGDRPERAATPYRTEPTRYLPAYADVHRLDAYQALPLFEEFHSLYDQVRFIQETLVPEHYGNAPEAATNDPVAVHVGKQWFYSRMANRVLTGEQTPQAAYAWGRDQLEATLVEARQQFR